MYSLLALGIQLGCRPYYSSIPTLHVNLSSALLELLLACVKVFVVPFLVGGGVKGKVLQAMTRGLPVVAYSVAVEGIDVMHGQDVLVAQDAQEFAQCVPQLHIDCNVWSRLSQRGLRIMMLNQRGYTYHTGGCQNATCACRHASIDT